MIFRATLGTFHRHTSLVESKTLNLALKVYLRLALVLVMARFLFRLTLHHIRRSEEMHIPFLSAQGAQPRSQVAGARLYLRRWRAMRSFR
ncbi:MAG: hypothetical protein ISS49_02720 [Anaerolineae bacterium]|nr:hypothetical protein [Anaerolineae bacterium]